MLKAIAVSNGTLFISVDSDEYDESNIPNGLLSEAELAQVREVKPLSLIDYIVAKPEPIVEQENEPNAL